MSLIELCLGSRYDVCGCNSLQDMTINSFFVTFDLHLWHSAFTLISRCTLSCICTLVPSMKFEDFAIWTIVCWKLNDVTMTSSPIQILSNSNKNLPRAYLSDKLNFILIRHKRPQIQRREVNRELRRKNGYYVIMTLTFDPRSPIWIGFERLQ